LARKGSQRICHPSRTRPAGIRRDGASKAFGTAVQVNVGTSETKLK
jgi:hypothetical protein